MACVFMLKLIIVCLGIELSFEESVTSPCGTLSYDEPAVAGRNVTLTFKPAQVNGDISVTWQTALRSSTFWVAVTEQWKYHLENFSLVVNTSKDDQWRQFYAQYGSCVSSVIKLKLEVIDGCGLLYERTNNVRPGGTVELGYFPTWSIINNEATYLRIFEITNSTCPNGCRIHDLPGVYETRALGYNHEYVLAITLRETFVNGRYRLRCTRERPEGRVYTKYIEVAIPERPNNPEFLNTQSIKDCRNCIVGKLRDNLTIRCNVTGGTAPLLVNITVAGKIMDASIDNNGIYTANVRLTAVRHMAVVQCSVTNLALDAPLFSEATLYIADGSLLRPITSFLMINLICLFLVCNVIPLEPVFDVHEMRDDASLTYPTCTSSGARPPSDVEFMSSNSEISNASRTTHTETANLYNTSVTLIKMEKDWNLQNLTCCVSHFTYSQEWCQSKQLLYKFKPESVRAALAENYSAIFPYYTYNVTCTVCRAYPACSVSWMWPDGVNKLDSTESHDGTNVVTTEAELSLNVSRKDNGKRVLCVAVCTDISFNQSEVQVMFVPYERTISFNVSSPINLSQRTTIVIECKARWASTVRWLDSDNRTTLLVADCGSDAACLRLENVSKKHGGKYTCLADDTRLNVSKQLTVTVKRLSDPHTSAKTDQTSSTIIVSSMACIVLLLAVIVLVVFLKRRNSKKSEMMQNRVAAGGADNREVDERNEEIHEYEEMHEYGGLADRGPSHAFEGIADRCFSNAYEGLAERGPSQAYEGLADRGSSHAYECLAERGPSHAYEGLADRGSSHAYEGLADRGSSHAYEGLADRATSLAYEELADIGSSHAYEGLADRASSLAYEELADIGSSHAYEGLTERSPSHLYDRPPAKLFIKYPSNVC